MCRISLCVWFKYEVAHVHHCETASIFNDPDVLDYFLRLDICLRNITKGWLFENLTNKLYQICDVLQSPKCRDVILKYKQDPPNMSHAEKVEALLQLLNRYNLKKEELPILKSISIISEFMNLSDAKQYSGTYIHLYNYCIFHQFLHSKQGMQSRDSCVQREISSSITLLHTGTINLVQVRS